jgi:hypothetical protein
MMSLYFKFLFQIGSLILYKDNNQEINYMIMKFNAFEFQILCIALNRIALILNMFIF